MGKVQELMEICLQKDEMISKLQTAMGLTVEEATRDVRTGLACMILLVDLVHGVPFINCVCVCVLRGNWWSPSDWRSWSSERPAIVSEKTMMERCGGVLKMGR